MVMAFYPMLLSGFALMQADPGDSRMLGMVLEHGHGWLTSLGKRDLWNLPFFYPEPNVAAFGDLLLGLLPYYSVFRALGLDPDSAFQGWMLTMGALNYLAAWLFLRRALGFSALPAAFGAFIFAFGSSRLCQLNHQQLLPQFYSLLVVHALVRMFQRPGPALERRWIGIFFAALVLQV